MVGGFHAEIQQSGRLFARVDEVLNEHLMQGDHRPHRQVRAQGVVIV